MSIFLQLLLMVKLTPLYPGRGCSNWSLGVFDMTLVNFDIFFVVKFYKMFIFVFTRCYFCYMVLQHVLTVLTHTSIGHFFKDTCLFLLVENFILINLFRYNQPKWLMNSLQIIVIISISFFK